MTLFFPVKHCALYKFRNYILITNNMLNIKDIWFYLRILKIYKVNSVNIVIFLLYTVNTKRCNLLKFYITKQQESKFRPFPSFLFTSNPLLDLLTNIVRLVLFFLLSNIGSFFVKNILILFLKKYILRMVKQTVIMDNIQISI